MGLLELIKANFNLICEKANEALDDMIDYKKQVDDLSTDVSELQAEIEELKIQLESCRKEDDAWWDWFKFKMKSEK